MKLTRVAATVFAVLTAGIVAFQLALALGAPWGSYAMGGTFSGTYPPSMRAAAVVQAALLVVVALVVLARAGVVLRNWARFARWAAWVVVAMSVVALVLNVITPSGGERAIWAPVSAVMLACSIIVAVSKGRPAAG
jgi:membrane-associated PAP2 superfamily phosphatase